MSCEAAKRGVIRYDSSGNAIQNVRCLACARHKVNTIIQQPEAAADAEEEADGSRAPAGEHG